MTESECGCCGQRSYDDVAELVLVEAILVYDAHLEKQRERDRAAWAEADATTQQLHAEAVTR
jgi:hypothetical protein